jgi:RND family efflux transporter MFP subunit
MSRLLIFVSLAALALLVGPSSADNEAKPLSIKLLTHKVQRESFQPSVVERGVLESAGGHYIVCRVKARSSLSQSSTTIKWIVENGSYVKKGDLLVELDDSGLREQLQDQKIAVDKATADLLMTQEYEKVVKQQAQSEEAAARRDLQAKKSIHEQALALYKEIEDQIKQCRLYAPVDGLAVYGTPERTRRGVSRQWVVSQGEAVAEGQKLLQIPDLGKMLAVIRIREALVGQVRPSAPASVRVDAFPDRTLPGSVSRVSTIPSQAESLREGERVHSAQVAIEGRNGGLLPGMSATVVIPFGKVLSNVLVMPVRAIIGGGGPGETVSCLILTPSGPEEREVVLGLRGERLVEVRSGLREGDQVIINPQLLLNDIRDRIQFQGSHRSKLANPGG